MGGLSWWHWLVVGAVFILLFGAKRLPDAARGVGRSLRILKSEVSAMNLDEDQAAGGQAAQSHADGRVADGRVADAAVASDVRLAPIEPAPVAQVPAR